MTAISRTAGTCLLICAGLGACGGSDNSGTEQPINVDYSALKVAESTDAALVYARSDEEMLLPLRNGARLMVSNGATTLVYGTVTPSLSAQSPYSGTTVQVQGVDEADSVKYDGRHIYATRREIVPASPGTSQLSPNVLSIWRTNAASAGVEPVSKYVIEGDQSEVPQIYQLQTPEGTTEYLVAVSQNYYGWLLPQLAIASLVIQPDRTTVQLLDVRDPVNVTQSWKLELDGFLRASRMIGETLYLVSSYRPRIPDLVLPADTQEKREANERRILNSTARELLPSYAENGGARRPLATRDDCLVAQQLASYESYTDVVVISAINMRTRRVTDVNCLSTNINSVYMSAESLYVAGTGYRSTESAPITVLHKLAIGGGEITYRATGAVTGGIFQSNPSYFMDEYNGDLRILTTANGVHRLTVLRESGDQRLMLVSSIPNATRPAPIGKPNESVYAVRFMAERAYVVTFRVTDPLYVVDLKNPADPAIAGELEIPGFSTYLRPVGPTQSELLISVGQEATVTGRRAGIKVQLFDVRDIAHPQLLGQEVFGATGTGSEALSDPHALTFLTLPGTTPRYRFGLPIQVADTPDPSDSSRFNWTYSGVHLFEVADTDTGAPQLRFQGVIKTEQAGDAGTSPAFFSSTRGVLHDDSVFAVHGDRVLSSLWQNLPAP
jgi:uncharacterized secreted protein with C-terminal beta-propeller domain